MYIFREGDKEYKGSEGAQMSVASNYPYADIFVYIANSMLDSVETDTAKNIESSIMHELCHVILWGYAARAESRFGRKEDLANAEEGVCEKFAAIINQFL